MDLSINSLQRRTPSFLGKRALLAPETLRSYSLSKDPSLCIILNSFEFEEDNDSVVARILSDKVGIVAFSTYLWNIERTLSICDEIKRHENVLIILGGPAASNNAEKLLAEHDSVDIIVIGEGEEPLYRITQRVRDGNAGFDDIPNLVLRSGSRIRRTEHAHFLSLDSIDYLLDVSGWEDCVRICYETARGCAMSCNFCLWHRGELRAVRYYSLDKVKKDLTNIFNLPKLEMLEFVDADITINKRRVLEILHHIRQLNDERERRGMQRVYILFESNPTFLNGELIEELAVHDRILDFGLQTIDEDVSRMISRPFRRDRYFSKLEELVMVPSKRYSEHMLEIIYGLPGDNLEGFKKTINYILNLPYDINFWSFRFLVMPGTVCYERRDEYGIVHNPSPPHEIIRSETWSEESLAGAATISFYFFLVQYGFPEVFSTVRSSVRPPDRFDIFDKLFSLYSSRYPQLNTLRTRPAEEVYLFHQCLSFAKEQRHEELRRKIILDSYAVLYDNT